MCMLSEVFSFVVSGGALVLLCPSCRSVFVENMKLCKDK